MTLNMRDIRPHKDAIAGTAFDRTSRDCDVRGRIGAALHKLYPWSPLHAADTGRLPRRKNDGSSRRCRMSVLACAMCWFVRFS